MDRFVGMAVFVKVVESKSFAAAARHFEISPAMVTKHVQALEERLGARLLNRTTRHVSPTEVGRTYYERCRRIMAEMEEAERVAGDMQATPRGLLKINAPFSFGVAKLAPAIADYLKAYPDVTVDLTLNDRYVDLVEEGFDLAIRIGRLADSSLIAKRLASVPMMVAASPQYLEQYGTPQTPQDLKGHNCLAYTQVPTPGEWSLIGPDGDQHVVEVSGRFQANNGDALRVLALRSEGIIFGPDYVVTESIAAGDLIRLFPTYKVPEAALYAVYPHSRYLSAKVRTFVDFLAACFGRTQARSHRSDEPSGRDTQTARLTKC